MQPVFDAPMGSRGLGEGFRGQDARGDVASPLDPDLGAGLDAGFDHGDGAEALEEDYEVGYGKRRSTRSSRRVSRETGGGGRRERGTQDLHTRRCRPRRDHPREREPRKVPFMEAYMQKLMEKALHGSTSGQIKLLKVIADYAPDLFEEPKQPLILITEYVLPNGKTWEDYGDCSKCGRRLPDGAHGSSTDEDDDWLK